MHNAELFIRFLVPCVYARKRSQSFDLLAKCMLMPVKCSIAGLLKAFTPFNLSFITYRISERELSYKQFVAMKLSVQCVLILNYTN